MKLWKQALLAALICGAGALAYMLVWPNDGPGPGERGARANGAIAQRPKETPVVAARARFSEQLTRVEAVGTAEAIRSATLFAPTAGEVREVSFTPDQRVKKGDVLVELDRRAELLALELARVRAKDASQLVARYRKTRGSGAVPALTIDQAQTALEARIQERQAQVALSDRYVRAPFDGHIGVTDVDVGDRIGPSDPIAVLDDRSSLRISFRIPEVFLRSIGIGQKIAVAAWAQPDAPKIEGEIIEIGSRIDPATRSFEARADRLRPGMGFSVTLELPGRRYLLAPEVAVQWGAEGPYIWAIRDGLAKRVVVRIIERQEGTALVDAPIREGELIVVEGIQRMREDAPVDPRIMEAAS